MQRMMMLSICSLGIARYYSEIRLCNYLPLAPGYYSTQSKKASSLCHIGTCLLTMPNLGVTPAAPCTDQRGFWHI